VAFSQLFLISYIDLNCIVTISSVTTAGGCIPTAGVQTVNLGGSGFPIGSNGTVTFGALSAFCTVSSGSLASCTNFPAGTGTSFVWQFTTFDQGMLLPVLRCSLTQFELNFHAFLLWYRRE
jgi:hypothetical protein